MQSMNVEAIKCRGCGRVGLSVSFGEKPTSGHRLTDHKCAGAFTEIIAASVLIPDGDVTELGGRSVK
jgi:hypothetical protein